MPMRPAGGARASIGMRHSLISDERTKLQEDTATRLAEETSAAEARIADEQAAARETIPEVAGDVTRAAVERLIGVELAEADAKSAVEAAMRGGV